MGRREQAEASRAALVAAARACFTESGYDGTTVAEVLRRAGMARGALYHYFPGGKDELFAVVYRDVDDQLHRRVDALEASESPLAALRESAVVFLQLCTRDDFARITVLEGPRVMADAATPHGSVLGRSYDRMHDGVTAAIDAGEMTDLDADVITTALYGAVRDLGARVANAGPRKRRAAASEAVAVLDLMLDGFTRDTVTRDAVTTSRATRTDRLENA